jgi:stage IV sporulation protein FB
MRPKISIGLLTITFFLVLCGAGIYYGNLLTVILLWLALLIHETAHFFFAELFGYQVQEFKLTPFGGCMVIDALMAVDPMAEFVISAAGPLTNFLMVGGVGYLGLLDIKNPWLDSWGQWNWLLGAVNLLPAAPLDGGRMLHALFKRSVPVRTGMMLAKAIGRFVGGLMITIGIIRFSTDRPGMLYILTGIFILYNVNNYQSPKMDSFWRMSEKRKKTFSIKGYATLKALLVKGDMLIRDILKRYGGDELLIFLIDNPEGVQLVTEEKAWELLIDKGYDATFKDFKGHLSALPK